MVLSPDPAEDTSRETSERVMRMTGKRAPKRFSTVQKFWYYLGKQPVESCWEWPGARTARGYGTIYNGNKNVLVHRFAYENMIGPIPHGLTIDHLCRNKPCCNPAHLEVVTQRENLRRGMGWSGLNARKTHCVHGHLFDDQNTYRLKNGWRACRACALPRLRKYYYARKAEATQ